MKTYPIIFSTPMIKALFEGKKTQTRRLVTSQWANLGMHHLAGEPCLLYVRETWAGYRFENGAGASCYKVIEKINEETGIGLKEWYSVSDDVQPPKRFPFNGKWRPSIHMPRWASRLTLEVTDVRLQKLRQITDADAQAEGFTCADQFLDYWFELHPIKGECHQGDWQDDPQVAAISFRVQRQNIDQFLKAAA